MTGMISHRPTRGLGLTDQFDPVTAHLTACFGKEAFAARADARAVIERRLAKSKRGNRKMTRSSLGKLNIYQCEHCHKWHIGTGAAR
jgi:hypothetical protein